MSIVIEETSITPTLMTIHLRIRTAFHYRKSNRIFFPASSYFVDFKLSPKGDRTPTKEEADYKNFFMNYLTITAQLPNLIVNFINLFIEGSGRLVSGMIMIKSNQTVYFLQ